ncbi:MAG: hypothetical protein ABL901_15545 [Hyphomicrobiaceae bacterium]
MRHVTIPIKDLAGTAILSGAVNGKAAFAAIIGKSNREPEEPTPLLLDFDGIEVATASFLREAVFALKSYMRASNSRFYPVAANINAAVHEELAVVADARGDALFAVTIEKGEIVEQCLIGNLDPKQAMTLEHVTALNGTDAGTLMTKYGAEEKTTSTTAWNNRLSALVSRGLIREYAQGRAKFYRPLFEGRQ